MDWTPLGVEFCVDGPQTWFPGNCENIVIQLSNESASEPHRAIYQLAHEVVHLLAPFRGRVAPVIEEGLATVFSEDILSEEFGIQNYTDMASYIGAAARVRDLLLLDSDAIRKLRLIEPTFKLMDHKTFGAAGLDVPLDLANILVQDFVRDEA